MTLEKRGAYWHGDSHEDLRSELTRYSERSVYSIDNFVDVRCECGNDSFHLLTDEDAGVAIRQCTECGYQHMMGDSGDFADEAEVEQHVCVCEADIFQITAGVHRYRNQDATPSTDVRWLYIGCRCIQCGLVGCYADWKNEFNGYDKLMAMM